MIRGTDPSYAQQLFYLTQGARSPETLSHTKATHTKATAAAAPAEPPPSSGQTGLLTPESLLEYCSNRLHSIDTQVETIFQQQQSSNTLMSDINTVTTQLSSYTSGNLDSSTNPSIQDVEDGLAKAINQAGGPKSVIGAELVQVLTGLDPSFQMATATDGSVTLTASPKASATQDQLTTAAKSLQNTSGDVNSDAQLNMIQLQSLISDQQTAVQLTTGMMQTMNATEQAIAGNVGRTG